MFDSGVSEEKNEEFFQQFPLLHYSSVFWFQHVRDSVEYQPKLWNAVQKFLDNPSQRNLAFKMLQISTRKRWVDNQTSLNILIRSGLCHFAEKLIHTNALAMNQGDDDGSTPLHLASERGQESTVECLLNRGASIEAVQEVDDVLLIVKPNARTPAKAITESTPLHLAARNKHEKTVRLLLRKGSSVDATENIKEYHHVSTYKGYVVTKNRTALHMATRNGDGAMVQTLLEFGADVNALEEELEVFNSAWGDPIERILRWSPWDLAKLYGHVSVAEQLLAKGGKTSPFDNKDNPTPYGMFPPSQNQ
jgi:ankyrin repeat protein